jgi:lipopolysaccharide/colanic/teichoic acid biosynthesis glycosyltransferase
VLGSDEFELVFQREAARSERAARDFALVLFVPERDTPHEPRTIERALARRIRLADAVGHVDPDRIGALLPETDVHGAWTFAEEVLQRLSGAGLVYAARVYTSGRDPLPGGSDLPRDRDSDRNGSGGRFAERSPLDGPRRTNGHNGIPFDGSLRNGDRAADSAGGRELACAREVEPVEDFLIEPLPAWKRAFDVVGSALLLLAFAPVLVAIGVAIRFSSPGPVIFKQRRAGLGGRPFTFYKFRSMCIDAEARKAELENMNEMNGPVFKIKDDPRITPLGRFLRKWSLDELPQLWNVLKGDMTLVGPRPPMMSELEGYERWQRRRLSVTGGITCIWQTSGRNDIDFEDWMRMDMRYLRRRTPLFDLDLLFRTVWIVVSSKGAY